MRRPFTRKIGGRLNRGAIEVGIDGSPDGRERRLSAVKIVRVKGRSWLSGGDPSCQSARQTEEPRAKSFFWGFDVHYAGEKKKSATLSQRNFLLNRMVGELT